MSPSPINICYYPTTAIILDDDISFLRSISFSLLKKKQISSECITNPVALQSTLTSNYEFPSFSRNGMKEIENDNYELFMKMDIHSVHHAVYSIKRFSQVSTLVVDYSMPKMNGEEFCERLLYTPFQKIMLTADSDQSLARKLYDNGLIQCFMTKSTPNIIDVLADKISLLQSTAFYNISSQVIQMSAKQEYPNLKFLKDSQYQNMFWEMYKLSHAVEYYLLDYQGSVLFLDENAKPTWWVVSSDDQLERQIDIGIGSASPAALKKLQNREAILYMSKLSDNVPSLTQ